MLETSNFVHGSAMRSLCLVMSECCLITKFHYTGPTGPDQTKSADFVGDPGLRPGSREKSVRVRAGPCGSGRVRSGPVGSVYWNLAISGRGHGHVNSFYIVDFENLATASRRYSGDIHNSTVVGLFMTPIRQ